MIIQSKLKFGQYLIDDANEDNDTDDDNDDYGCNSVNFQARTFRFRMDVDLDNT